MNLRKFQFGLISIYFIFINSVYLINLEIRDKRAEQVMLTNLKTCMGLTLQWDQKLRVVEEQANFQLAILELSEVLDDFKEPAVKAYFKFCREEIIQQIQSLNQKIPQLQRINTKGTKVEKRIAWQQLKETVHLIRPKI